MSDTTAATGDLAKVKIDNADQQSVVAIAQALADEAARLRAGKDDNNGGVKGIHTY